MNFLSRFYTAKEPPTRIQSAYAVGKLSGTIDWKTETFSFVADSKQQDHDRIIIHAIETSGTVLANCIFKQPITNFNAIDTALCVGNAWTLKAEVMPEVLYKWNTGEISTEITVSDPGEYTLTVTNHTYENIFSTTVTSRDCELRLVMPNFFTPNRDEFNQAFIPIDHNYFAKGTTTI
jgi:hypothetical protein